MTVCASTSIAAGRGRRLGNCCPEKGAQLRSVGERSTTRVVVGVAARTSACYRAQASDRPASASSQPFLSPGDKAGGRRDPTTRKDRKCAESRDHSPSHWQQWRSLSLPSAEAPREAANRYPADGRGVAVALVPLTSGALGRDSETITSCCWSQRFVICDGESIEINDPC